MPIIETKIDRFDGGIVNDLRDPRNNVARIISNFDALTNSGKLTPYRSSESGDDAPTTSVKRNFVIALRTGTTYSLYALGVVSGTARAEILFKNLTTGAANDLDDATWTNTANNQSASGATDFNLFVYYARQGRIYGAKAGTTIWAYDPAGTATIAEGGTGESLSVTYTNIAQGLVHSKDDILYVPYDNKIARNNAGTWTAAALTLPTHLVITSIAEYGNFLAIGCEDLNGLSNSRVFLWDRDSSLTTVSESIDWGTGRLRILEEVDGELVGVSLKNLASSHLDRVIFRKLVGNKAVKFLEVRSTGSNTTIIPLYKQRVDNRLFFQMLLEFNGAVRDGVWSVGRSGSNETFALVHERTSNNDTALGTEDNLRGFLMVGDYLFQSYIDTDHATSKTDDTSTFSHNSVYESERFGNGVDVFGRIVRDPTQYKDLKEGTITTEYMPTAGQITFQYRVNQNTAWTTIFVNTTDNSISHTAVGFEGRTATMTIASPAVVTLTAHGLVANDPIYFTTTGALPTGVTANTSYYVISAGLATDSFRFSATQGGSAVNTSGSQSGTHTLQRINGSLPNDYKEIEFRVVSTGGAEVTGISFKELVKSRRFEAA